jgi:hypothetical protein
LTLNLSSELEQAVTEEAAQKKTTVDVLIMDALQKRFLKPSVRKPLPQGATLADALVEDIGSISTRDNSPDGSTLSENTGRKFAQRMAEKHKQGQL